VERWLILSSEHENTKMEKGEQGGATVLVVDDDDVVTKVRDDGVDPSWISCFSRKQLLQKWMEEAGYKCVVAQNAEQAWKDLQNLLNKGPPRMLSIGGVRCCRSIFSGPSIDSAK
jgi:CheY-like chemotaxis protein